MATIPSLTLLRDVAPLARGGTTRINAFFYVDEETIQRWNIEPEFCWPLIKSSGETDTIRINPDDLGLKVFVCRNTKDELRTEGKVGLYLGDLSPLAVMMERLACWYLRLYQKWCTIELRKESRSCSAFSKIGSFRSAISKNG